MSDDDNNYILGLLPHPPAGPVHATLGNFSCGHCRFARGLLALEAASPPLGVVPYDCSRATTLRAAAWGEALASLPGRPLAHFLLGGVGQGFRIGVAEGAILRPSRRDLRSAYDHPEVVTQCLQREVELGGSGACPSFVADQPLWCYTKEIQPR